jgi:hypothetical protein
MHHKLRLTTAIGLFFFISFFACPSPGLTALPTVGVHITNNDADLSLDELRWLESIGIEIIKIDGIQNAAGVSFLSEMGFRIWVGSGVAYIRSLDIRSSYERAELKLLDPLRFYVSNQIVVERYIVTAHPYVVNEVLIVLENAIQTIRTINPDVTAAVMLTPGASRKADFETSRIIFAVDEFIDVQGLPANSIIYLLNGSLGTFPLHSLRELLKLASEHNQTLLIPIAYLRNLRENWPDTDKMIALYTSDSNAAFSLDNIAESPFKTNITALLFIVGVSLLLLFMANNGPFHRSLSRYAFTHNFYVNDVVFRRIKTGSEIPVSFMVSGYFFGLLVHVIAEALDYVLLRQMMEYYSPFFFQILNPASPAPFISGFLLFTGIQLFITLWLYLSLTGKLSIGQILQLVQPPSHFIIPVSGIITILYLNGLSGYVHIMAGLITPLVALIILFVASADIYFNLHNRKSFFLAVGPVLFAVMIVMGTWYLITVTNLAENLSLAIQLMDQ